MPTAILSNFKARVAGYLNREASEFVVGGVDNLLEAINDSRRTAQQIYSFNSLRTFGFLNVSSTAVDWKTTVYPAPTASGAFNVKLIEKVWTYNQQGSIYIPVQPVRVLQAADITRGVSELASTGTVQSAISQPCLNFTGDKCYAYNFTESTWLMVQCVKRLGALTGVEGDETDFFVNYGAPWLLLETARNLNYFLKEDVRVQVAQADIKRAWDAFLVEDAAQANMAGNLDNLD